MTDFRYAFRVLARNPGFTALMVVLLAFGTGATTAIFSLFDAVLLRPLPVRNPDELVRLVQQFPKLGPRSSFPYSFFRAVQGHASTLAAAFAETGENRRFRMTAPGAAEQITVHAVTSGYFDALGVQPLYGRVLHVDDELRRFDKPPAVLSHEFWQRRFGGDPQAVRGRDLTINGYRFAIVGVMPRGFHGLSADTSPDVRVSIEAYPLLGDFKIDEAFLEVAARVKPGVPASRAEAERLGIWQSAMKDYYRATEPDAAVVDSLLNRGLKLQSLERGTSVLRERFGDVLKLLLASVLLLSFIVCINVAGLLLAQAASRRQETAVRLATGATPFRIARLMFAESLLLALLGSLGGIAMATAALPLMVRLLPPVRDLGTGLILLSLDLRLNLRVLLFSLVLFTLTTITFSVGPALASSRVRLDSVLRSTRGSSAVRGRQVLITLQIALCTFMLIGASLLVRTFQQLRNTDPGFNQDYVATYTVEAGTSTNASAYRNALISGVRDVPGVVSVSTSSVGVMRDHGVSANIAPAGQRVKRSDFMNTNANRVSPDYFSSMGIRLLAGRDFIATDALELKRPGTNEPIRGRQHRMAAIINETFGRHFFPGASAIGKLFGTGVEGSIAGEMFEVIGVVGDAKYRSLREQIRPMFFTVQTDFDSFVLNVRSRVPAETLIPTVRKAATAAAPDLPLLEVHTLAEEIDASTAPERIVALLALLFGGIAALLAGVGTYGLLTYLVLQRRREIGIRMALGADTFQVAFLVARQTLILTGCGLSIGIAASLLTGAAIRPLLFGVTSQSLTSLLTGAVLVLMTAIAATIIPIISALGVDPAMSLRLES